ncbi:Ig-like domain-containing protein [Kaistella sp.]|uniref:Ig-like domain-containing protein n=1 Tax=Kaistella sp. TaxID=2782235 RepID=UPI002F94DE71
MKQYLLYPFKFSLIFVLLAIGYSKAQVTIFQENFETIPLGGVGTWQQGYFGNAPSFSYNYFTVQNCPANLIAGTRSMQVTGITSTTTATCSYVNNQNTNPNFSPLIYHQINATGYDNITLSYLWKCNGQNNIDYGRLMYSLDGNTWSTLVTNLRMGNGNTQTVINYALPAAIANTTFYLGWSFVANTGTINNPGLTVDNIEVKGSAIITCDPISATASKYVICPGETTTLTASSTTAGYTYTWYTDWDNNTHTGTLVGSGASVSVSPAQSTLYGVVATKPGCPTGVNAAYSLINIAVTPTPTLIVLDPVEAIACSDEYRQISVVSGGNIPDQALNETWNPVANPWITSASASGGNINNAQWALYDSGGGFSSNDKSVFAMVNSDAMGPYSMESSLISPPFSLNDYNTPVNLTFYHHFRQFQTASTAYVEISTNGTTWTTLRQYSSTVGGATSFAAETISLDSYAGQPFLQLRFRYNANYAWYWAIDNIAISGVPKPTTVTWSPVAGLFTDVGGNVPYVSGQHATTLYASPSVTTTYTVSATTAVGCPVNTTVTVERGDKSWTAANGNWNTAATWAPVGVPTSNHCVKIPNGTFVTVNIPDAKAKNITVKSGGKLEIAGNLTVTDFIKNETGNADNFVVKNDGNLIQINPVINTDPISAEREVTDMNNMPTGVGAQMDYVYWSAPVSGQKLRGNVGEGGFSPGTPNNRFFEYNEATDYFVSTPDVTFAPGKGYAIRAEDGYSNGYDKTYLFRGVPNNGEVSVSIKRSPDVGTVQHGFNLVGNPYPSNIDFTKLYANNSGLIYNTAYFWTNSTYTPNQQGSGYGGNNYAVFNGIGGNPPTGGTYQSAPNGIVKVGQGFIVQKKDIGGPVPLVFKNSYGAGQDLRVSTSGTFYQKSSGDINRFWLQLESPLNLINTQLIGYVEGATADYEQDYDAEIMGLSSDVFYSKAGDRKVLIQGKGLFGEHDKVVLGANFFQNGNYTISLQQAEGIFAVGQDIYLKDQLLNTFTNLKTGNYTFAANKGISDGRFEIIYKPETILSTAGSLKDDLLIFRDRDDFVIRSRGAKITGLEVYDGAGRLIWSAKPNQNAMRIPGTALGNGMYVLKADRNGNVTAKKIVK